MNVYHKVQVWIKAENKILVFKVVDKRGGGWHPVTGSVEEGEDIFHGAIRETTEETGLDLVELQAEWINLDYMFQFQSERKWHKGIVEEHVYGLVLKIPAESVRVQLDPNEHTEAKWVSAEEAMSLIQFPNQKIALNLFLKKMV